MRIVKAEGVLRPPKVLIYGPPGVGKTVWAAQFAPRPALHLDYDVGGSAYLAALRDAEGEPLVDATGLDLAVDITPHQTEILAQRLQSDRLAKYRCIIIDTLTMLQQSHRETLMGIKLTASQSIWGENGEWCRRQISAFIAAPVALVVVAHDRTDIVDNRLLTRPALSPMLGAGIEPLFDVILYMGQRVREKSGLGRILVSAGDANLRSKDRTGRLPPTLWDASGREVYQLLTDAPWEAPEEESPEEEPTDEGGKEDQPDETEEP